jgi:hypothetical protein
MSFDTAVVVDALIALERQIPGFRSGYRELRRVTGGGDQAAAVTAVEELREVQGQLTQTMGVLTSQVVGLDGERLGRPKSAPELAVRAALHVLAACTYQLQQALAGDVVAETAGPMFVGRFRGIDGIVEFTQSAVARAHMIWMPLRDCEPPTLEKVDRVARQRQGIMYRSAVNAALRSIRELGDEFDYVHFLCAGLGSGSRVVRTACTQLLAVVNLRLDAEAHAVQSAARRGMMLAR